MASRAEAFGRVTVEYMLKGIPVIGARSGATTELISDKERESSMNWKSDRFGGENLVLTS